MTTPKLALPELSVSQAGKELTHNQALAILDQLAQAVVVDKDLGAPPGSPVNGEMYIVAAGATGAWSGKSGNLAFWLDSVAAWTFITPVNGWSVWVSDESKRYEINAGTWIELYSSASTRLAYGASPPAWGGYVFSIDLFSASISSNFGVTAAVSNNLYYDGTNWRTKTAGSSAYVQIFGDSISFQNAPSTSAGSVAALVNCLEITSANKVLAKAPAGMGYGIGAGGSAVQATSKATGVTLNKPCGQITMNAASLAASTAVGFTFTNSLIASTDNVVVNIQSGAATGGTYTIQADAVDAGTCRISLRNLTAGALAEALVLNFSVHKSVIA